MYIYRLRGYNKTKIPPATRPGAAQDFGRDRPKPAERRSRSFRSQVQVELAAEGPNPALGRKV